MEVPGIAGETCIKLLVVSSFWRKTQEVGYLKRVTLERAFHTLKLASATYNARPTIGHGSKLAIYANNVSFESNLRAVTGYSVAAAKKQTLIFLGGAP